MDSPIDIKMVLRDPERLADTMNKAAVSTERVAAGTKKAGQAAERAIGPYTRLAKLTEELSRATAPGSGASYNRIADLSLAAGRAQRQVMKLEAQDRGAGGGGRGRSFAGFSEGAAGAAAAAGAAGELTAKFFDLLHAVADATNALEQMRAATGASGAEAGTLRAYGIGARAVTGLRSRALSDPFAYSIAAGAGGVYAPGPYQQDDAGQFLRILHSLRGMPKGQRQYAVRALGLEDQANYFNMSDAQAARADRTGALAGQLNNPQQAQIAADFAGSLTNLGAAAQNAMTAFSGPVMQDLTSFFNSLADFLNTVAAWVADHKYFIAAMTRILGVGGVEGEIGAMAAGHEGVGAGRDIHETMDRSIDATDRLTAQMAKLNGNLGSGEGFNSAIPASLMFGPALQKARLGGQLAQGALG